MKKRILSIIMALVFILTLIPAMAVYANQIRVTVDGQTINFTGQQPVIIDGRTLVPIRAVFEHLGFVVGWDAPTQTATITKGDDTIIITIGSAEFTTNGASHKFDVQAQIIGGSTLVPIRLPLESVGYSLNWDGANNTVLISSEEAETTPTTAPPATAQPSVSSYKLERVTNVLGESLNLTLDTGSISMEEAARIGSETLINYFRADLNGATIHMQYSAKNAEFNSPALWTGSIMPGDTVLFESLPRYSFTIDAETGEPRQTSFDPAADAAALRGIGYEELNKDFIPPTSTHAIQSPQYARYGIELARSLNIFYDNITRARILQTANQSPLALNKDLEYAPIVNVHLQSAGGRDVAIQFDLASRQLRSITFSNVGELPTIFDWVNN